MKAYMFDVTWNVSKNYKIKAESYEEAYKKWLFYKNLQQELSKPKSR